MPRNVDPAILAEVQGAGPKPVLVVSIATGKESDPFLRFTSRDHDVEFGGETYEAVPIELDETSLSTHEDTVGPRLRVMDLDDRIGALVSQGYDFTFARVRIFRTTASGLALSTEPGQRDDWFVDYYERTNGAFSFALKPMVAAFSQKIPLRTISKADGFPGIPDPD